MATPLADVYSPAMPSKPNKTFKAEIIGGIFSSRGDFNDSEEAFLGLDLPGQNFEIIFHPDDKRAKEAFLEAIIKAIRSGEIRATEHDITNTAPVIGAIDDLKAASNAESHGQPEQLILFTGSTLGKDSENRNLSNALTPS